MDNLEKLQAACPDASPTNIKRYADSILDTFKKYDITNVKRQAAFLAQCGHESGGFSLCVENLNYSREALMRVWPKRFPSLVDATPYHRNPQKIANRVYANRMGNGDEGSGEGFIYRGRGLIQITGKDNYRECGKSLGVDLISLPEILETPLYATLSAGWFWDSNKLNKVADTDNVESLTKKINGGTHGLEDRQNRYAVAKAVLSKNGAFSVK